MSSSITRSQQYFSLPPSLSCQQIPRLTIILPMIFDRFFSSVELEQISKLPTMYQATFESVLCKFPKERESTLNQILLTSNKELFEPVACKLLLERITKLSQDECSRFEKMLTVFEDSLLSFYQMLSLIQIEQKVPQETLLDVSQSIKEILKKEKSNLHQDSLLKRIELISPQRLLKVLEALKAFNQAIDTPIQCTHINILSNLDEKYFNQLSDPKDWKKIIFRQMFFDHFRSIGLPLNKRNSPEYFEDIWNLLNNDVSQDDFLSLFNYLRNSDFKAPYCILRFNPELKLEADELKTVLIKFSEISHSDNELILENIAHIWKSKPANLTKMHRWNTYLKFKEMVSKNSSNKIVGRYQIMKTTEITFQLIENIQNPNFIFKIFSKTCQNNVEFLEVLETYVRELQAEFPEESGNTFQKIRALPEEEKINLLKRVHDKITTS